MKQIDFDHGTVTGNILGAALPMLVAQILSLLYNIVDRIYIARIPSVGTTALGAVGLCFPIIVIITAFSNLFGSGGAPLFSINRGKGNIKKAETIMNTSFSMLCICGAVLMVIGMLFASPILVLFGASEEGLSYAYPYMMIYLLGTVPSMIATGMNPFINAQGYATSGMLSVTIGAVANLILDPLFIFELNLGIKGAAIATVLAQIIAFVICWIYMIRKYEILRLQKEDFKDSSPIMVKEMVSAGMSMGFMSSLVNIGTLTLQTAINKLGKDIIIAHTAARKISEIFMIMFSVFGQTMATYCGQNMGAGKIDRVKRGIWLAIVYTAIWSGLTIIASYTIGGWLVYLVTGSHNKTVILNATNYLKFDTLFYIVTTLICILRNAMQGLGDHITPLISSGLEMAGKIVIAATLVPWLGYTGVIICEPIVWFIMVIPLLIQTFRMPVLRTEQTDGKI